MSRWTEAAKRIATDTNVGLRMEDNTVSLKVAPWEENKDESNRDNAQVELSKRTEKKVREGT